MSQFRSLIFGKQSIELLSSSLDIVGQYLLTELATSMMSRTATPQAPHPELDVKGKPRDRGCSTPTPEGSGKKSVTVRISDKEPKSTRPGKKNKKTADVVSYSVALLRFCSFVLSLLLFFKFLNVFRINI